jgi:hypothetical protein
VGIYPAGNLVELDTGEIAVVLKPYASDPYRPRVTVLTRADGQKLEHPYDVNLWNAREGQPRSVRAPVDASEHGLDPLAYL